jgi:hypothetical protein
MLALEAATLRSFSKVIGMKVIHRLETALSMHVNPKHILQTLPGWVCALINKLDHSTRANNLATIVFHPNRLLR